MNKLIIFSFLSILGCNYQKSNKKIIGWHDFDDLSNLKMKGVIFYVNKDIGNGYHGRGVVRINILETNITSYDPSKYQENYYCKIKGKEAEIYDNNLRDMNVGDTIQIDTTVSWKNLKNEKFEYSISIGEPAFFEYIKENKLQKL
ncbi:hypothetical protein ACQWU4_10035 [Chryseobacterium sp. MIQD13]|uniref:hypothetical protein n=1 Tax=Chryseobacterium sp. MIQD13 TaxID=3422310 RepID=UPI003D2C044D